ncbi:hypothetical protein MUY35_01850 [Aliiroseovarius sp. S1339]|uniref:hypothetical protein n=1 Tax=Aliiroseovarius sp. S1339 TaxID=2936990 RepID=UPI0020BF1278|nr:hypothetical protein [Aliiroseovarius sp. S1339]MCK8462593.1 hypothetical protein [Aliiroseovarius sp. S1339]
MAEGFRVICVIVLLTVLSLSTTPAFAQQETSVESESQMSERARAYRRVIADLEAKAAAAEEQLKSVTAVLEEAQLKLKNVKADTKQVVQRQQSVSESVKQAETAIEDRTSQLAEIEAAISAAKDTHTSVEEELKSLTAEASDLADTNALAEQQLAYLTRQKKAAKSALEPVTQEVEAMTAKSQALKARIEEMQNEQSALSADVDQLRVAKGGLTDEVAGMQSELLGLGEQMQIARDQHDLVQQKLAQSTAEAEADEAARNAALTELEVLFALIKEDQATLADTRDQIEQAQAELSALVTEQPTAPKPTETLETQPAPAASSAAANLNPRAPDAVRNALRVAPGLGDATTQQRDELERLLVAGTCTHEALVSVFDTINRQTLVSLLRNLRRC